MAGSTNRACIAEPRLMRGMIRWWCHPNRCGLRKMAATFGLSGKGVERLKRVCADCELGVTKEQGQHQHEPWWERCLLMCCPRYMRRTSQHWPCELTMATPPLTFAKTPLHMTRCATHFSWKAWMTTTSKLSWRQHRKPNNRRMRQRRTTRHQETPESSLRQSQLGRLHPQRQVPNTYSARAFWSRGRCMGTRGCMQRRVLARRFF